MFFFSLSLSPVTMAIMVGTVGGSTILGLAEFQVGHP